MKLTLSGRRNGCVWMPESAWPSVCLTAVSRKRSIWTSFGAITLNVIDALPPVTVTVCAVSGAVNFTLAPVAFERLPAVFVQVVLPVEWVSLTSSPTPMSVRVRAPGDVATVSLVIDSDGAGDGAGGAGARAGAGAPWVRVRGSAAGGRGTSVRARERWVQAGEVRVQARGTPVRVQGAQAPVLQAPERERAMRAQVLERERAVQAQVPDW